MFKLFSNFYRFQQPVVDVGLSSSYANELAELFLGTRGKSGSWSWEMISYALLDENGAASFPIEDRFTPGQKVRVMVKGVIQVESEV
jgi:hypothetical protein